MNKELDLIESYFTGKISDEEKLTFEKRIETDHDFAESVSFYISGRDALKRELYLQKKVEFNALYEELATSALEKKGIMKTLVPYIGIAAAACFLIFFIWISFPSHPSAEKLASTFMEENLQTLSVTMGGTEDTLQLGISAFNTQDYQLAEQYFSSLIYDETLGAEALKYLGLTYLQQRNYDKALEQFERLSAIPDLYSNLGPFYKALTLMKRSKGNDEAEAKLILKEVIENDLSGKRHAEIWMEVLEN